MYIFIYLYIYIHIDSPIEHQLRPIAYFVPGIVHIPPKARNKLDFPQPFGPVTMSISHSGEMYPDPRSSSL